MLYFPMHIPPRFGVEQGWVDGNEIGESTKGYARMPILALFPLFIFGYLLSPEGRKEGMVPFEDPEAREVYVGTVFGPPTEQHFPCGLPSE